jgi:solute carrier family 25 (mitochondrial dicarboxylate transporter), member 10
MQTQGAQRSSIIRVLQTSVSEYGIFRGLFTGISASIMRQMSYSLVRLGSYEAIKQKLSGDGRASTAKLLLAAALAGGLGGVSGNPAGSSFRVVSF